MYRLVLLALVLVGCAHPQHESQPQPVGETILAVGIVTMFVLVLIPAAAKPWK